MIDALSIDCQWLSTHSLSVERTARHAQCLIANYVIYGEQLVSSDRPSINTMLQLRVALIPREQFPRGKCHVTRLSGVSAVSDEDVLRGNCYRRNKKHLKNVGPIRDCEPPHAHSAGVASGTVARRLHIDVHDANDDNDNA